MVAVEVEHGEPIEALLRRLYYDEGLTLWTIGERLNVNYSTVWHWLRRCGIQPKQLRPPEVKAAS